MFLSNSKAYRTYQDDYQDNGYHSDTRKPLLGLLLPVHTCDVFGLFMLFVRHKLILLQ